MIEEYYKSLKTGKNLRKDLIALKQALKEESLKQELLEILQGDISLLLELLQHPEPKVRGNAALVLGRLGQNKVVIPLYKAYQQETQLFIKSNYLSAMKGLDISICKSELEERLRELEYSKPKEEEEKHIREELKVLRNLLQSNQKHKKHKFQGYDEKYEVILTTEKNYQEITAKQIKNEKIVLMKNGVHVITNHIKQLIDIPTYKEILFPLNQKKLAPEPKLAAKALANSNLMELLKKAYKSEGNFYFRLGVHSKMPLDKRSVFAKKCAFALEKETSSVLCNSTSDYEVEIRLMETKEGNFLPLLKFYTLEEKRFAYRAYTVATSIRPELAALMVRLARCYMSEYAKVLDPFCGVGTMLIERDRICPARTMYGIDLFGEAIKGARENAKLAGKKIHYIQRDFFTFQQEYLFDEIITNMPDKGRKTKEEQDLLYEKFFQKASEILEDKAKIFMYSNEKNFVKKQLRLRKEYTLIQEYPMDSEGIHNFFVLEVNKVHNTKKDTF